MRKVKKFAKGGGTGRADAMRDRRMADIEKDYKRALARGMSERQAQAKRDQRIADARDDYAKRTGADRTETRAAERAAEQKLTATRRGADTGTKPVSVVSEGSKSLAAKADMPEVKTPKVGDKSPAAAPRSARRSAPPSAAAPRSARRSAPAFDIKALRALEAEVTRPSAKKTTEARAALSRSSNLPAPVPIIAPLTGLQAIAKRRREAEQERRPPASDTANAAARLRQLGGAKFAKGGKIDGIAIRGKTKAGRKK